MDTQKASFLIVTYLYQQILEDAFSIKWNKAMYETTYHPETDDQTEVLNRCIQQYLQSFVYEKPYAIYTRLNGVTTPHNTVLRDYHHF